MSYPDYIRLFQSGFNPADLVSLPVDSSQFVLMRKAVFDFAAECPLQRAAEPLCQVIGRRGQHHLALFISFSLHHARERVIFTRARSFIVDELLYIRAMGRQVWARQVYVPARRALLQLFASRADRRHRGPPGFVVLDELGAFC
jgi:hypothetical protein